MHGPHQGRARRAQEVARELECLLEVVSQESSAGLLDRHDVGGFASDALKPAFGVESKRGASHGAPFHHYFSILWAFMLLDVKDPTRSRLIEPTKVSEDHTCCVQSC